MNSSAKPKSLEVPHLLFVEGYSDLHFLAEFLEHLGDHESTYIVQVGGKGNFATVIPAWLQPSNTDVAEHIGVVLDADKSAATAFASIRAAIKAAVNVEIEKPGVWTQGRPSYGAYVLPGAGREGELETAAWEAWSGADKNNGKAQCIAAYLECASKAGAKINSPDKVRVGAMLAVHNEDDPRVGPGAQRGLFDFESPVFAGLKAFLTPLAVKPAEPPS